MAKKSEKKDNSAIFTKLAEKNAKYLKDKQGELLNLVYLKGEGNGFYWSTADKRFVFVPKKAEYYLLPWERDEMGRIFIFGPAVFGTGVVLQVAEDEIEIIGFN